VEVFALKPWVHNTARDFIATLKGVATALRFANCTQPFQGCEFKTFEMRSPRVSKQTLGWNLRTPSE
jgi:hypothetical protein